MMEMIRALLAGGGIGIDRRCMMLLGQESIVRRDRVRAVEAEMIF
jgi:lysyl-tRNA synthetase class II